MNESTLLTGVADVSVGDYHVVALLDDGTVYTWGSNSSGKLGNGTITDEPNGTPSQILTGMAVEGIFTGPNHSFALLEDGSLMAWGLGASGKLGNGRAQDYTTPQPVPFEP